MPIIHDDGFSEALLLLSQRLSKFDTEESRRKVRRPLLQQEV
jgi:hypothetical protein